MTKPDWQRIALAVAIVLPIAEIADLGFFQLKHQALVWANGGRWCDDVDEASGRVLEFHGGDVSCDGEDELITEI